MMNSAETQHALLHRLQSRFEKNMHRHPGLDWTKVEEKLAKHPDKCGSLQKMEETGGEPDVVGYDVRSGEFLFVDCAVESPSSRRSLCYDHAALDARKENKPQNSALQMAAELGVEILTEEQYRNLQQLEAFDTKTSSWIKTPDVIRKLCGALFCDRRYDHVFTYHNGAGSYYAARGFRGLLRV
ncbi:MAG: DUF4256 domain-containing protein [Saprospiraceae bacterium]